MFIYSIVVGYVDSIQPKRTIRSREKAETYEVMKFIINNNDGCRIQCNIWNKEIEIFEKSIVINEVKWKALY